MTMHSNVRSAASFPEKWFFCLSSYVVALVRALRERSEDPARAFQFPILRSHGYVKLDATGHLGCGLGQIGFVHLFPNRATIAPVTGAEVTNPLAS